MENNQNIERREIFISKEFLLKIREHWKICLFSVFIFSFSALLINHYSLPVYEVSTTILLKREKPMLEIQGSQGIGSMESQLMVSNEIEALKSAQIVEKALKQLPFGISYYVKIPFAMQELYKNCPFEIIPDSLHQQLVDQLFQVTYITDTTFTLSLEAKNISTINLSSQEFSEFVPILKFNKIYQCNKKLKEKLFAFFFIQNKAFSGLRGQTYYFTLNSRENLISNFRNLAVASINNSTVIRLSVQGNNVIKLVDYINKVSTVYLEKSVEKKLISATNTINFIETQLSEVSDSLKYSEKKLQDYQSAHKVMDIDFHTQQVFNSLEKAQNEKAELLVKQRYFNYLNEYLKKNSGTENFIAPASIGIDNKMLDNMLNELMEMMSEKAEMKYILKKDIPNISTDDGKIEGLKKALLENISNMIDATDMSINDVDKRINEISEQAGKLPKTQRELFGYQRVFKLNDDIYTFLLKKRSEIQISSAGLIPDHEIINQAHWRDARLVYPDSRKNLIYAFLLGLGIPIIIIFLNDYFNEKIRSIEDIEKTVSFPVLGHIIRNKSESKVPVFDEPNSLISESFRSLRTNFQFVAPSNEKHVVLITSSMMDEGKSYVSLNLASSFALFDKKTLLLCFDLRKPLRNTLFNMSNEFGISTYLSGNCELEECIQKSPNENLDIILPGPIPPNPNELIASKATQKMIEKLKSTYDYIIIDTPPVGMIADSLLLINYSDVNIFMVRHNHTRKSVLHSIASNLKKRNVENVNIIINDLPLTQNKYGYGYSYGYGYNYNYGYGYGYYHKNKSQKNIFSKIFNRS